MSSSSWYRATIHLLANKNGYSLQLVAIMYGVLHVVALGQLVHCTLQHNGVAWSNYDICIQKEDTLRIPLHSIQQGCEVGSWTAGCLCWSVKP